MNYNENQDDVTSDFSSDGIVEEQVFIQWIRKA